MIVRGVQALLEGTGAFATPLVALALATFGLATRAGLLVRRIGPHAHRREARDVSRTLRLLAAAAAAAPLVGLLGTVHGLITLFAGLADAGAFDRDVLTRGVGQALFTTEFGLAIAVPGIVLHAVIARALRTRTEAAVA